MKFEPIRQMFRPLFGLERRGTTAGFLYATLISMLVIDVALIVFHLLDGPLSFNTALQVLLGLLISSVMSLFMLRRGHISLAALLFLTAGWMGITYQAWRADGVYDTTIYVYILIVFIAALLTNWQIPVIFSILSITAIWFFAITEARGLRVLNLNSPLNAARDLTAIFLALFFLIYLVIGTIRRSLDAVREGEEKFRRIFHVSPVAIAIISLEECRLIDANEAYWRMTGLDPKYALHKTCTELGIWNNDSGEKIVSQLREKKSLQDPAYELKNRSGERRTALAFYELIDFENQPAVMSMFYDITEQKKAQLALQTSEQKYRNFIEQSMEGIWFLAFDPPIPTNLPAGEQVKLIYERGRITECNDTLAHMYGYSSRIEFLEVAARGQGADEKLNEINHQTTLTLVKEGYRSGSRETEERTRDGEMLHFLNSAVGVVEDGYLLGVWGTQLDITVLKNTEDALRRSEARTHALLDAVPDMIFEVDRDGLILQFVSSSADDAPTPLLPPEQFLGRSIRDVIPSIADQTSFAIERVLESGRVYAFEYPLARGNENKFFEARVTYLSADTVLVIVRDISIQKWIQSENENLIAELERKNAELERFTYTVSHDLKSPLITIKGFLGFLREDTASGNIERLEGDIQRISDAADKMQRLLNDLLELSRIGRLMNEPQSVDLNAMVAEVLELLHGRLHGGKIRVSVARNLPDIYGDPQRLFEVLQNLVDNAAKFMGEQPDPCIEIGQEGMTADGMPILFVRDNGIGIDPKFTDRIFGLFDKLDPRTDGTGIGLALVRRIIEVHKGKIWVESEPGRGATFYFTLPQAGTSNSQAE